MLETTHSLFWIWFGVFVYHLPSTSVYVHCVYEESIVTTCKMTRLSSVAQETITEEGQFQNPKPQSGRSRSHNLSISLVFKPLPWLGILLLWWRSIVECHKIYPYVKRAIVCLTKQEILSFSVTRWWTSTSGNCTYTNLCFHITDRISIDETGVPTSRNSNPNTTTTPQSAAWNCTDFEFHSTLTQYAWQPMSLRQKQRQLPLCRHRARRSVRRDCEL